MKKGGIRLKGSTLIDVAIPEARVWFSRIYKIRLWVVDRRIGRVNVGNGFVSASYTIGISSTRLIRVRSRRRYPSRSTYTLGPDAYICDAAA